MERKNGNLDHKRYHFVPNFSLPEAPKESGSLFFRPEPPIESDSEINPIQIGIKIPADRLARAGLTSSKNNKIIDLTFIVKGSHIAVKAEPEIDHRKISRNWYHLLDEQERVNAMQYIIAEFQHHAVGNDDFKIAAIGITKDYELFISNNTRSSNSVNKQCAELGVIKAALAHSNLANQNGYADTPNTEKPKALFVDFYLMGGSEQRNINAVCPCGLCTDALYQYMSTQGEGQEAQQNRGNIYVFSTHPRILQQDEKAPLPSLKESSNIQSVKDLQNTQNTYWKTSIEHLHGKLYHKLPNFLYRQQIKDRKRIIQEGTSLSSPLLFSDIVVDKLALQLKNELKTTPNGIVNNSIYLGHALPSSLKNLSAQQQSDIWKVAAGAVLQHNPGLAAEAASNNNSLPSHNVIQTLLSHEINKLLLPRIDTLNARNPDTSIQDKISTYLPEHIHSIRSVALRFSDGSIRTGVSAVSKQDSSLPNAELNALSNALDVIGKGQKATHMWVSEFNPKATNNRWLPTPTRDGVERVLKQAHPELQITLVPYSNKLKKWPISHNYQPGNNGFMGRHGETPCAHPAR